jgi:hypothetical protein
MSSVVPSDRFAAYVVLCFSRGLCGTELDFQIIFVIVVRGYVSVGGSDEDQQKMTCVVLHSTAQGDFSSTSYDAACICKHSKGPIEREILGALHMFEFWIGGVAVRLYLSR